MNTTDKDFYFYDANRQRTSDPDAVAFIAVRCMCQPCQYLLTAIADLRCDVAMVRTWNKNMATPTIEGSFDSSNCPCHFSIEDGKYK